MSTVNNLGKIIGFTLTPEMLDAIANGASLITIEQAHTLMSLSSERALLNYEMHPGEERMVERTRIQYEIEKIWTDVFGK